MNKRLITFLKFAVSAAILAYLVMKAQEGDAFGKLANQPKRWEFLAMGGAFCLAAVIVTFVRWMLLVRAVGLPFTLQDALRLGFLGYLFNFVSLGSVGGDLFKVVFLAREHRERKADATASVVLDRIIGLYGLFLVASVAVLTGGWLNAPDPGIRQTCRVALYGAGAGTVGLAALFLPGFGAGPVSRRAAQLKFIGPIVQKLLGVARAYREQFGILVVASLMSMGVHTLTTIGIYCYALGLPGASPTFADHFIIVPIAILAGALPLPLGALGAFEGVVDLLYVKMSSVPGVTAGQGLIVALVYRLGTVAIAMLGVVYYVTRRREVQAIQQEADSEAKADEEAKAGETAAL